MTARVSKLDSALIVAGLVVWAALTLWIVDRLVHGQIGKLHTGIAQNGLVAGAFLGCGVLNVALIVAVVRNRETSGGFRIALALALLLVAIADIVVLYGTWHDAQPVSV